MIMNTQTLPLGSRWMSLPGEHYCGHWPAAHVLVTLMSKTVLSLFLIQGSSTSQRSVCVWAHAQNNKYKNIFGVWLCC